MIAYSLLAVIVAAGALAGTAALVYFLDRWGFLAAVVLALCVMGADQFAAVVAAFTAAGAWVLHATHKQWRNRVSSWRQAVTAARQDAKLRRDQTQTHSS